MKIPTKATIETRLAAASAVFLANDSELLKCDVHERALTHKYAEALQTVFRSWHVDCEYNREGKSVNPKRVDLPEEPGKTVYPDIIIHRRKSKINLLIIEAKPNNATQKSIEYDKKKLQAYMDGHLHYHYALALTFNVGEHPGVKYDLHCLLT